MPAAPPLPADPKSYELKHFDAVFTDDFGAIIVGPGQDDGLAGSERPGAMDLVRLAIPRRVYTQSHIDYVAEAVIEVASTRDRLRGYRIVSAPRTLRHFTATLEPLA